MIRSPYRHFEKRIGYRFKRKQLLTIALTHPSHAHENGEQDVNSNNQRLEFLGDAALGLAAAAYLYETYPELQEGQMTKMRSSIVNTRALAAIARTVDLGSLILLGKGEAGTGGGSRDSNLADALEAVIGAAWLDGGLRAVQKIFQALFVETVGDPGEVHQANSKGQLQEMAQRRWRLSPRYSISAESGPAHAPVFEATVHLGDELLGTGRGSSKRVAEMEAAERALDRINRGDVDFADPAAD